MLAPSELPNSTVAVRALTAGQGGSAGDGVAEPTLDEIIERRAAFLAAYQNAAYAQRYRDRVAKIRAAEEKASPGATPVTEAVARNLFKLMAIKDE